MAEVTIRFRHNPATGKREVVITYESDSDALPHEHERDHRALVESLLGHPLGDDVEGVRVERVNKDGTLVEDAREETPAARTPQANKGGG
jgi:hypothetical protein